MSAPLLRSEIRSDLASLADTLGRIAATTGKDGARLVAAAAVQFLIGGNGVVGMAKRTRDYAPARGAITAAAASRGWRVKIAHRAALARAERESFTGAQTLYRRRASRLSTTQAGVTRAGGLKLLVADRRTGQARLARSLRVAKGKAATELPFTTDRLARAGIRTPGNAVALNRRAIAVYYELRKREGSRAYVASSYAFKGISALRAAGVRSAQAQARSASGKATGLVSYRADGKANAIATISNLIPMRRRNLDAAAALTLRAVLADKEAYLRRKLSEKFTRDGRSW